MANLLTAMQQQRHVELPGTTNLRNLGGFRCNNGKHVKWGVLYRSDQLSGVAAEEQAVLVKDLHIRHTFDLRGEQEVQAKSYSIAGIERNATPMNPKGLPEHLASGKPINADIMRELMIQVYAGIIDEYGTIIGGIVRSILSLHCSADCAALIHCTAGKDRTGLVCYLILSILDVVEEDKVEDFVLTNRYFKQPADAVKYLGGLPGFDEATMKVLWSVELDFLEAAKKRLEAHGGVEVYATTKMGLTTAELQAFRALLLED